MWEGGWKGKKEMKKVEKYETLPLSSLLFAFWKYPNKGNLPPYVSCPQDFPLSFVTVGSNVFYLNRITSANESVTVSSFPGTRCP